MKTGWIRLGRGAWKQQKEPWVWRQTEQWQRWVGSGSDERGMVMVKWTDLQWHWPVSVVDAIFDQWRRFSEVSDLLALMEGAKVGISPRLEVRVR